jgi:hypothetical protein
MLTCRWRRRRSGRTGGKARGGTSKAREDGAEEEDVEEAYTRSMGIKSPGGQGRSGRKPPAFQGPTATDRWCGRGVRASAGWWTADFGRPAEAENPVGQRTGGHCGRRRSGRMTAAAVEDTTTMMAADRGRKSG